MRKHIAINRLTVLALFAALLVALGCRAQGSTKTTTVTTAETRGALEPYAFTSRFRVAVLRFENGTGSALNERYLDRLQEGLVARLLETQRVRLIERGKINSLLKEHELAQKGIVDYNDAKKIGMMLSADALLLGSLASVRASLDATTFVGETTDYAVQVEMNGRIIDVGSSEVLASAIIRTQAKATEHTFAGIRSGSIDKRKIEETAVQRAIDELGWKLASLVPPKQ